MSVFLAAVVIALIIVVASKSSSKGNIEEINKKKKKKTKQYKLQSSTNVFTFAAPFKTLSCSFLAMNDL